MQLRGRSWWFWFSRLSIVWLASMLLASVIVHAMTFPDFSRDILPALPVDGPVCYRRDALLWGIECMGFPGAGLVGSLLSRGYIPTYGALAIFSVAIELAYVAIAATMLRLVFPGHPKDVSDKESGASTKVRKNTLDEMTVERTEKK